MRKPRKKQQGLGDTIEAITEVTGIKALVKFIAGDDCGCEERKTKLNELFPYKVTNCLKEESYNYLDTYLKANKTKPNPIEQIELLAIYNKTFNTKVGQTNCDSCWIDMINELKQVYETYIISE
jgi:hypothetical protein